MPTTQSEVQTLLTGLGFGESPRWHQGRLWFSNWGAQEIVAVDLNGNSQVVVRVPTTIPFCMAIADETNLKVIH
jgi:sugar lactone lactonase YvrE